MLLRFFSLFCFSILCVVGTSQNTFADERSTLGSLLREELYKDKKNYSYDNKDKDLTSTEQSTFELGYGSAVTIIAPKKFQNVTNTINSLIYSVHKKYERSFGKIPPVQASINLMDEDLFYLSTGAPSWTNALYYKGQIMIPVANSKNVDMENITRSVKHEYTHAVIHAMSGGKCPGWVDEGLAQWAEGPENPALQPALLTHLKFKPPVALGILQNGFTKLDTNIVPAAYAQSLYATNAIINGYGIGHIGEFLRRLKQGERREVAFRNTFKTEERIFERDLGTALKQWAGKHNHHS